ncbi:MAG: hypothetical protein H6710_06430 [Myxococcales bacterium]|nr:hypothetical protein [Myxococcales bacterium]
MNDSAKLTDAELREAAAEAGISPEELRRALVQRSSDVPATRSPSDALATHSLEGAVPLPPEQATEVVRRVIERRSGHKGHRQGGGRIDVVDDEKGVVYQISGEADGAGGALVKVEVSAMSTVGSFALGSLIVGTFAVGLIALGYLMSSILMWLGVAAGVAGIAFLVRASRKIEEARTQGRAIAAEALLESEEAAPLATPVALPPQGREGY